MNEIVIEEDMPLLYYFNSDNLFSIDFKNILEDLKALDSGTHNV